MEGRATLRRDTPPSRRRASLSGTNSHLAKDLLTNKPFQFDALNETQAVEVTLKYHPPLLLACVHPSHLLSVMPPSSNPADKHLKQGFDAAN